MATPVQTALIIVICILIIWNYRLATEFPEMRVRSSFDGEIYTVKARPGNKQASDILARLNNVNNTLIAHVSQKYGGTRPSVDIQFLNKNYNGNHLSEHTPRTTVNTSYVLNKGDAIKLCLRDPTTGKFHNFDTLLFVNLHELSHLLDRQFGHHETFWQSFAFILREAHEIGLYNPVDYSRFPVSYCGMIIKSNPYWDTA